MNAQVVVSFWSRLIFVNPLRPFGLYSYCRSLRNVREKSTNLEILNSVEWTDYTLYLSDMQKWEGEQMVYMWMSTLRGMHSAGMRNYECRAYTIDPYHTTFRLAFSFVNHPVWTSPGELPSTFDYTTTPQLTSMRDHRFSRRQVRLRNITARSHAVRFSVI